MKKTKNVVCVIISALIFTIILCDVWDKAVVENRERVIVAEFMWDKEKGGE